MNSFNENNVPVPFRFNGLKHHAGYIINEIDRCRFEKDKFISGLKYIGNSQTDLYVGNYTLSDVYLLIKSVLVTNNIFSESNYKEWLRCNDSDYRIITLPDISFWAMREGTDDRYIHFHPGRYSPYSVRVKASVLKTAELVLFYLKVSETSQVDLMQVNELRREYLNLPPLKEIIKDKGFGKIITLLREKTQV